MGVLGLGDGAAEDIENAGILADTGDPLEFEIKVMTILLRQLLHAIDAEELEVAERGGPDSR